MSGCAMRTTKARNWDGSPWSCACRDRSADYRQRGVAGSSDFDAPDLNAGAVGRPAARAPWHATCLRLDELPRAAPPTPLRPHSRAAPRRAAACCRRWWPSCWAFDWNWCRPLIRHYVMSHSGRSIEFDDLKVHWRHGLDPTIEFRGLTIQNAPWAASKAAVHPRGPHRGDAVVAQPRLRHGRRRPDRAGGRPGRHGTPGRRRAQLAHHASRRPRPAARARAGARRAPQHAAH